MGCVCTGFLRPLTDPARPVTAPADLAAAAERSTVARTLVALDRQVATGQPGLPPGGPDQALPSVPLPAHQLAGLAARTQLRTQALAQCGVDLDRPEGVAAMRRLIATLAARVQAATDRGALPDLRPWQHLAQVQAAAARLQTLADQAAEAAPPSAAGLPGAAGRLAAAQTPTAWQPFVTALQPLALLMQVAAQTQGRPGGAGGRGGQGGETPGPGSPHDPAALQAGLEAAAATPSLPALPPATVAALSHAAGGLAAMAQLSTALGADVAESGYAAAQAMVASRVSAAVAALRRVGVNVAAMSATAPAGTEAASLPTVPGLPAFATPALVRTVRTLDPAALAALRPVAMAASPGSVSTGLAVTAFLAHAGTALGARPSPAPCAGCDQRALVAALAAPG